MSNIHIHSGPSKGGKTKTLCRLVKNTSICSNLEPIARSSHLVLLYVRSPPCFSPHSSCFLTSSYLLPCFEDSSLYVPSSCTYRTIIMYFRLAILTLVATVKASPWAMPQGVTAIITPSGSGAPAGCTPSTSGSFAIAIQALISAAPALRHIRRAPE